MPAPAPTISVWLDRCAPVLVRLTEKPTLADVLLPDDKPALFRAVAVGLSRIPRFSGQTAYSDAEHSVLLARLLAENGYSNDFRRFALLHDAPEAVGPGDINSNLKRTWAPTIRVYEAIVMHHLWAAYGGTGGNSLVRLEHVVKEFDGLIGRWERNFFGFLTPGEEMERERYQRYGPRKDRILSLPPAAALDLWMKEWDDASK